MLPWPERNVGSRVLEGWNETRSGLEVFRGILCLTLNVHFCERGGQRNMTCLDISLPLLSCRGLNRFPKKGVLIICLILSCLVRLNGRASALGAPITRANPLGKRLSRDTLAH